MRIHKPGMGAEELELAAGELLLSKIREFLDERVFPPHDLATVETHIRCVNAPGSGVAGQVQDFGSVQQCLRRHATAQDTEAADLLTTFDDDGFEAVGRGGSRRCVTGAATADNGEVEIKCGRFTLHCGRMSEQAQAGKSEAPGQS